MARPDQVTDLLAKRVPNFLRQPAVVAALHVQDRPYHGREGFTQFQQGPIERMVRVTFQRQDTHDPAVVQ